MTGFIRTTPSAIFPGCWELTVDDHPQSLISPDPTELRFDYIRRMGDAIDTLPVLSRRAPITAVHIGAGGCSLPRYIAHTRPRSRQQVLELDPKVVESVRALVPISKRDGIRFRYGDAAETISKLPPTLEHNCDVIVHDAYLGQAAPAQLATAEFLQHLTRLLAPAGICLINVAVSKGDTKRTLAPFIEAFPHHGIVGDQAVYRGRREGNLVVIGANCRLETSWLQHLAKVGPQPAAVLD